MGWNFLLRLILAVTSFLLCPLAQATIMPVYPCKSQIYCQGPILEAVSRLRLFNVSKEYVDMTLKKPADKVLEDFKDTFPNPMNISKEALETFIQENFREPGWELISYNPTDWTEKPEAFDKISDPVYRNWAYDLNLRWKRLCKKIHPSVKRNQELSSIIYLPNEFVVPGGRFREAYYWDAYWIIKGLLHSGMIKTARSMIGNYLTLVQKHGFVPNGGRIYYLERSQPPLLIYMVYDYYKRTSDKRFLRKHWSTFVNELEFWQKRRSLKIEVDGRRHTVYHYNSRTNTPRPESHKEDIEAAGNLSQEDKAVFYSNIASAAESGWDFSSRWLSDGHTFKQQKTRLVLPVDLNAFICGAYKILADLNTELGKPPNSQGSMLRHKICRQTMMTLFYNQTEGAWFDYHLDTEKHNLAFYPSNLVPLFTGCYKFQEDGPAMRKLEKYLNDSKALQYKDGIPTSLTRTGQQWDLPNAWAPLVHMVVEGLDSTSDKSLKTTAFNVAERWVMHNYIIYNKTDLMFEKYDVVEHRKGSGGEYGVQDGFGWTNGVIIDLLIKYGSRLCSNKMISS